MDTEEPVKIQPSRRRFVEVLLGGGLFASILSAIYPQRICKRARSRSRNAIIAARGAVLLSLSF